MKKEIPLENVKALVKKINKIINRAKKNNLPPMELVLGEIRIHKNYVKQTLVSISKYQTVELTGIMPIIEGYKFVAKIEHTGNGNIVKSMHKDLPLIYTNHKPDCDHCKSNRQRKETYILNKDQQEIQVGTECIKNYMSLNSAEYILMLAEVESAMSGCDEFEKSERVEIAIDAITFIATAIQSINKYGWEPSTFRESTELGTGQKAWYYLTEDSKTEHYYDYEIPHTSNSMQLANDYINELFNNEPKDTFTNNIKVILTSGVITRKDVNIVATAAKTILSAEAERKAKALILNEFAGNIGDKLQAEVVVSKKIGFDTNYGHAIMFIMADNSGRQFKTVNTGKFDAKIGDKVTIKGTVKALDEYKGIKQTVLTRVRAL